MELLKSNELFVGMEIEAWFKTSPDTAVWNQFIPCRIIDERQNFFVCEVLPHKNPKGWGISEPYRMTINKFSLDHGLDVSVRRGLV